MYVFDVFSISLIFICCPCEGDLPLRLGEMRGRLVWLRVAWWRASGRPGQWPVLAPAVGQPPGLSYVEGGSPRGARWGTARLPRPHLRAGYVSPRCGARVHAGRG